MAVTINGTNGIVFNDGTTQSTAITSTTVLNAIAGQAIGAVGTVAVLLNWTTTNITPDSTVAGSNLGRFSTGAANPFSGISGGATTLGTAQSGTWRALTSCAGRVYVQDKTAYYVFAPGLYLRIS